MKRMISILTAAALALSLGACSAQSSEAEASPSPEPTVSADELSSAQSYTGQVAQIDSQSITLTLDDGSEVSIPLTEETVFMRGDMGAMDGQAPGEPPAGGEKPPEGEMPVDGQQPPEGEEPMEGEQPPEGEQLMEGAEPPELEMQEPPENMPQLSYEDIAVGDQVTVTLDNEGYAATVAIAGMGGPEGGSQPESYNALYRYDQDAQISSMEIVSTGSDENAILVSGAGATVTVEDSSISRSSGSSTGGDQASFYGVGAAALVTEGTLSISSSEITTDADGGAGVFAYGEGTAYVADSTITTNRDTSGGIHVAGGGSLYAWDLTVETSGESSAAIRSDRGSGTMVIDGGSYITNGTGSPAVYSTADITVNEAQLTANGSEAVCIEGSNSLRLFDSDLSGSMVDSDQNDTTWNVILYQSMSGDAQEGNSSFEMVGGSLTANNGGMFYTTNTQSTFLISGVEISYAQDSPFLLQCTGNANERGWGAAGANGADCSFTALDQSLEGNVIWDSISQLDFYLDQGSSLTGAFIQDESYAGEGGDGYASLYIGGDSTWTVTGDSSLTSLYCTGTIVDDQGYSVSVIGRDGTVYQSGDSQYTITVDSFSTEADMSGAASLSSWSDFQVERI